MSAQEQQVLRQAADMFHEIGSAISAEDLVASCRNAVLADKLREKLRSRVQLGKIAADGLELCSRGGIAQDRDRAVAETLRRGADLFHEIKLAIGVDVDTQSNLVVPSLLHQRRSHAQLRSITADGFELCVLALAAMGAPDVTIHECGKEACGEQLWGDRDEGVKCTGSIVHDEFTACPVHDQGESSDPMRCTGALVHGEYTACPVHDRRPMRRER